MASVRVSCRGRNAFRTAGKPGDPDNRVRPIRRPYNSDRPCESRVGALAVAAPMAGEMCDTRTHKNLPHRQSAKRGGWFNCGATSHPWRSALTRTVPATLRRAYAAHVSQVGWISGALMRETAHEATASMEIVTKTVHFL
jgi:hypothetical protein